MGDHLVDVTVLGLVGDHLLGLLSSLSARLVKIEAGEPETSSSARDGLPGQYNRLDWKLVSLSKL